MCPIANLVIRRNEARLRSLHSRVVVVVIIIVGADVDRARARALWASRTAKILVSPLVVKGFALILDKPPDFNLRTFRVRMRATERRRSLLLQVCKRCLGCEPMLKLQICADQICS